jgi:uncharacterized membrane protein YeaQ/YmgE (transglycosylase-associated protein family)
MLLILSWLLFGLIVGLISKALHPGDDPVGLLPTLGIGVVGSFIGGFINWLLSFGNSPFQASGFIMSVLGGVVCCVAYRYYRLKMKSDGPRSFISGKKLR